MSCGLIDIPCQLWGVVGPFWFWIQVGFWIMVCVLLLWGLSALKTIGGWPAVATALGTGLYVFGWWRGKRDKPLIPHIDNPTDIDGPDADPSPTVFRPRKPRLKPPAKTIEERLRGE